MGRYSAKSRAKQYIKSVTRPKHLLFFIIAAVLFTLLFQVISHKVRPDFAKNCMTFNVHLAQLVKKAEYQSAYKDAVKYESVCKGESNQMYKADFYFIYATASYKSERSSKDTLELVKRALQERRKINREAQLEDSFAVEKEISLQFMLNDLDRDVQ